MRLPPPIGRAYDECAATSCRSCGRKKKSRKIGGIPFMKALLIYPEWPDTYWSFKHALPFEGKCSAYPPLGLLTVSSLLPAHWNKRLVDTNVRRLTEADLRWADVAMLSGMLVHKQDLQQLL